MNLVSFSPDLSYVRVGLQLFSLNDSGNFEEIEEIKVDDRKQPPIFEHLVSRDRILVLASRRKMPKFDKDREKSTDCKSKGENLETDKGSHQSQDLDPDHCQLCSQELSGSDQKQTVPPPKHTDESSNESDNENSAGESSSSSSESSTDDSAEDSWSEGSTDVDQFSHVPWNGSESSGEDAQSIEFEGSSKEDSNASDEQDSGDEPTHSYGQLLDEDESDGGDIDFGGGFDDDICAGDSNASETGDCCGGLGSDSDGDDMFGLSALSEGSCKPEHEIRARGPAHL